MADQLVLVTGASGFIAAHVVQQLQNAGYRVRGTVRSLSNEAKVAPLKQLAPEAKHELELVEADLTKDEGWEKAVAGCWGVVHTASPFPDVSQKSVKENELLEPALAGCLRVLKAAAEAGVQRFVLTSSFAAVFAGTTPEEGKKYTEEDWSDPDSATIDAYSKSKVMAERAAWAAIEQLPESSSMQMAVVNPVLVLGPPLLRCNSEATSVGVLASLLNHTYPGVPRLAMGIVDVRDVAACHIKALTTAEAQGKRHIVFSDCVWMKDIASVLAKEFKQQGFTVFTNVLPYFVMWLAGAFNTNIKSYVLPRLGKALQVDNTRMVSVLGVEATGLEKTVLDMAYAMVDLGIVAKTKKYKQFGSRAPVAQESEEKKDDKEEKEKNEKKKEEAVEAQHEEKKDLEKEEKQEVVAVKEGQQETKAAEQEKKDEVNESTKSEGN